jgi:hypothetical protein
MRRTVSCLALLTIIALCFFQVQAMDFDVADYNAFPDDGKDDTTVSPRSNFWSIKIC